MLVFKGRMNGSGVRAVVRGGCFQRLPVSWNHQTRAGKSDQVYYHELALVYRRTDTRQTHSDISAHTTPMPSSSSTGSGLGDVNLSASRRTGTFDTSSIGRAKVK